MPIRMVYYIVNHHLMHTPTHSYYHTYHIIPNKHSRHVGRDEGAFIACLTATRFNFYTNHQVSYKHTHTYMHMHKTQI